MKTPINKLLEKARMAPPPERPARSSWAAYESVVAELCKGGRSIAQAIDWLVSEGEIPESRKPVAYKALQQLFARRKKAQNKEVRS